MNTKHKDMLLEALNHSPVDRPIITESTTVREFLTELYGSKENLKKYVLEGSGKLRELESRWKKVLMYGSAGLIIPVIGLWYMWIYRTVTDKCQKIAGMGDRKAYYSCYINSIERLWAIMEKKRKEALASAKGDADKIAKINAKFDKEHAKYQKKYDKFKEDLSLATGSTN